MEKNHLIIEQIADRENDFLSYDLVGKSYVFASSIDSESGFLLAVILEHGLKCKIIKDSLTLNPSPAERDFCRLR
jgi:hypothetical protein